MTELDWAPLKRMANRITHEVLGICRVAYDLIPKPRGERSDVIATIDRYHSSLPSGLKQLKRKVRLCSINVESPFLKPPVRRRFNRNILLILIPAHARVLEPGMNSCSSARLHDLILARSVFSTLRLRRMHGNHRRKKDQA